MLEIDAMRPVSEVAADLRRAIVRSFLDKNQRSPRMIDESMS